MAYNHTQNANQETRIMNTRIVVALVTVFALLLFCPVFSNALAETPETYEVSPVGVWSIRGIDQRKTRWIATMVIVNDKKQALVGYIEWLSDKKMSGREHIAIRYDAESRKLVFVGTKVEYADGIGQGRYSAEISKDGSRLLNGSWGAAGANKRQLGFPGNFSGDRIIVK